MDITWSQFLIICPLVFLAGFVDAVAGGGGLISLPAYFMGGLPVHYVLGTNKLSSSMGTAITTWKFARRGWIEGGLPQAARPVRSRARPSAPMRRSTWTRRILRSSF